MNQEFQSKSTGEHVRKSFLEVAGEVVGTAIEAVGDVLIKVVDTVGGIIEKALDWTPGRRNPLFCYNGGGSFVDRVCDTVGSFISGIGSFFGL